MSAAIGSGLAAEFNNRPPSISSQGKQGRPQMDGTSRLGMKTGFFS